MKKSSIIFTLILLALIALPSVETVDAQSCFVNSYQRCVGDNLYWFDSCGRQGTIFQPCPNGCYNNSCLTYNQNYNYNYSYNYNCTYHAAQRCSGNNLYWFDSCGNQQDLAQYCSNGCYNNYCQNYNQNYNYNNYSNCTYHAYKLCQGNNVYWYDSCGNQQDLYSVCGGGQTCQYGQCATYVQPIVPPVVPPVNTYVPHSKTACYSGSIYWYDSLGAISGLYKNCIDSNSCTADTCSSSKCVNTLKCDGSTCAAGSADYATHCAAAQPATQPSINTIALSFFAKQDATSTQWQKTAQIGANSTVYFMISVANNSTTQVDNVNVAANIPSEVSSLGNLQLNGIPVSGDIVSGINIGSLAPATAKSLTFEGKTQAISEASTKQAVAANSISGSQASPQTDSVLLTFAPGQAAAVSAAPVTSGFWDFLKRWYLWILAGLVLILLFVFVFRRLSSEV